MTSPPATEPRTLGISRRPFLSIALALSPMLALAAVLCIRRGPRPAILFLGSSLF